MRDLHTMARRRRPAPLHPCPLPFLPVVDRRRYCQESRGDVRWVGPQDNGADWNSPSRPRFPARALGEMCVGLPSAKLRLERHVVETLLVGSKHVFEDENAEAIRLESLAATGKFHGCKDWKLVDSGGRPEAWWELAWEWYDERF